MTTDPKSLQDYEALVDSFRPKNGPVATNPNDLRRFIYEWFTHFEHRAPTEFYLSFLVETNLDIRFPGSEPMTSRSDFAAWYEDLMAQTLWNFHDISAIQVKQTSAQEYLITFVVNWYGEVREDSDELAEWQSRSDSCLYHQFIRQTWSVTGGDRPLIHKLVAADGNSTSPITE